MPSIKQLLLTLNILAEDIADELAESDGLILVSKSYIDLLKQYLKTSTTLSQLVESYTDKEFKEIIKARGICLHLVNKKMLMIQNKLLTYLIEYSNAASRLDKIRDADFSVQAEIRFDLLTTRAVKSKSQFKTVADALSDKEYQSLVSGIGLPELGWRED